MKTPDELRDIIDSVFPNGNDWNYVDNSDRTAAVLDGNFDLIELETKILALILKDREDVLKEVKTKVLSMQKIQEEGVWYISYNDVVDLLTPKPLTDT